MSVIQWVRKITEKKNKNSIQFDIVNFYPSITEKLLKNAIDWAASVTPISDDVLMGAYDSAECCDIVGFYLVHQLQNLGIKIGLYRDDGLASPFQHLFLIKIFASHYLLCNSLRFYLLL